jgi:hypothetical protein
MRKVYASLAPLLLALTAISALASEIKVGKTTSDLSKQAFDEAIWKDVKSESVSLMAQPMAIPRPKTTTTAALQVQALQDGQWIAFRLRWRADQKSEAGRLGEFSDAVAMQFPVKEGSPPPIFMGAKDNPVHIFHWRAQYQRDLEKGKPEMKDLYPNMNPDMYPMEFKDPGHVKDLTEEKREVYSPGKAAGNPQSYQKASAVDEIFAEGFGSSSVIENRMAIGKGVYNKGEWSVVIARPLKRENGSVLDPTKNSFVAFAVWQGAKQEVGARKCVTMAWVPLQMSGEQK